METPSYFPNYYSINDLFVTQETIPCYISEDYGTFSDVDSTESLISKNNHNTLTKDSRSSNLSNDTDLSGNTVLQARSRNSVTTSYEINSTRTAIDNSSTNVSGPTLIHDNQMDRRPTAVMSGKRHEIIDYPLWSLLYKNNSIPSNNVLASHIYKDSLKEICDADANPINLCKINTHFYELGRYIIGCGKQENIKEIITGTCRQRLKTLKNICYESGVQLTGNDMKKEYSEKLLFQSGCKTIQTFSEWLLDRPSGIETSSMVSNHKKRKREKDITLINTKKRTNE